MLSLFPPDLLDDIWDSLGSVSEGFPYFCVAPLSSALTNLPGEHVRAAGKRRIYGIFFLRDNIDYDPSWFR